MADMGMCATVAGGLKTLLSSGATNTATATATGNVVNNAFNVAAGGSAMLSKIQTVTLPIFAAGTAYWLAAEVYKTYDSKDDYKLLFKLGSEDCGGLSKMPPEIEGCYKQYVGKAIHRTMSSPNYKGLYDRFLECFSNRPEQSCGWWGENVFSR